uniref:neuronal regeneration-related protein isoform X1 n=1 Tax=Myodes glareolus TaxID=447135 RepID=UPI00202008DC|nr:neuronal regeneration-related protein isoform X1 [Myodes glareolus]
MMPFFIHICVSGVERRESEQGAGLLSVYYPELLVWVSQEPFPYKEMEGSLTKGRLPVPKEVNRKKMEEISAASLTPEGSYELCSPNISYLYSF